MKFANATKFDRKSGVAELEGPAVSLHPIRHWEGMTILLHRQQVLGAPFKPHFGLSGRHSTCCAIFVIRSEAELTFSTRTSIRR
jgi:hypothetical protein